MIPQQREKPYNQDLLPNRGNCGVLSIDPGLAPDKPRKGRKHSSKVLIFSSDLVAVLMLGSIVGLIGHAGGGDGPHESDILARTSSGALYTSHSPIYIQDNAGFTNANGVVGGSGVASDPFVIANWDINASTVVSGSAGIYIQNTSAHLVIMNCYVHDGRTGEERNTSFDGIYLLGCSNSTLENNTCWRNRDGIAFDHSSNITLRDNNCSNNNFGIDMSSSSHITMSGNICILNTGVGIYFTYGWMGHYSGNNTLSNNTCSGNRYGIDVFYVTHSTLSHNKCRSNVYAGILISSSLNSLLRNNDCSSNGLGIQLSATSNITLATNTCNSNSVGITIEGSSRNGLIDNTCSNNHIGILIGPGLTGGSSSNKVSQNLVCNNTGYGASIIQGYQPARDHEGDNRIWNNTFIGNNGATDTYNASHLQACDNGTNNSWNSSDGYGNWWSDWPSPDEPYVISGSAEAKDNHPLVTTQTPIPKSRSIPSLVIVLIAIVALSLGILAVTLVSRQMRRKKDPRP